MIVYANKTGTDVITIAGYAADAVAWTHIETLWAQALDLYGIRDLNVSSFLEVCPEEKRRSLVEASTQILRNHASFGVAGVLHVQDYERHAPQWFQWENEHPYYFAFQLFFDMFLGVVEKLPNPPLARDEKLTFILDQNEFMQRSAGTFLQLKALRDARDRLGAITFQSRKESPMLQVANLIACMVRDEASKLQTNQLDFEWVQEMRKDYNLVVGVYNRENIPGLIQRIMAAKLKAVGASFEREIQIGA